MLVTTCVYCTENSWNASRISETHLVETTKKSTSILVYLLVPNHRYESFTLQSSWTHAPSARGLKTSFTHTCRQQIRKYKSTVIIDMWEFLHTRYGGYGRAIKWLFLPQFYVLVITYSIFFFFHSTSTSTERGKIKSTFFTDTPDQTRMNREPNASTRRYK